MFNGNKKSKTSSTKIESLIGHNTELNGDLVFSGGLHIDGVVKGNVIAHNDSSLLTLSDKGRIEGNVKVPHIVLNGKVIGDVYASERVELAAKAQVKGNVYYNLIEMAMGAEVNGSLVHNVVDETAAVSTKASKKEHQQEGDVVESSILGYLSAEER